MQCEIMYFAAAARQEGRKRSPADSEGASVCLLGIRQTVEGHDHEQNRIGARKEERTSETETG
jgi:hypothetical protein